MAVGAAEPGAGDFPHGAVDAGRFDEVGQAQPADRGIGDGDGTNAIGRLQDSANVDGGQRVGINDRGVTPAGEIIGFLAAQQFCVKRAGEGELGGVGDGGINCRQSWSGRLRGRIGGNGGTTKKRNIKNVIHRRSPVRGDEVCRIVSNFDIDREQWRCSLEIFIFLDAGIEFLRLDAAFAGGQRHGGGGSAGLPFDGELANAAALIGHGGLINDPTGAVEAGAVEVAGAKGAAGWLAGITEGRGAVENVGKADAVAGDERAALRCAEEQRCAEPFF